MKVVDADFVPRSPPRTWPWWAASALFIAAAAFELSSGWRAHKELQRLQAMQDAVPAAMPSAEPAFAPPYHDDALRYARMASLDIAGTFASLESARVQGVRVTSLDIRAEDAQARVELEVRAQEELLRYLEEINAGLPRIERWELVRAQAATSTSPGSAVLVKVLRPRP